MSDDGADMGITPERALETVLGGKPSPEKGEGMSREEMHAWLESATPPATTYDDAGRLAASVVLRYLETHPEDASQDAGGLYDAIKAKQAGAYEVLREIGMSGFQWGWAVNAAKYALEQAPVSNPAIMTIDTGGGGEETRR